MGRRGWLGLGLAAVAILVAVVILLPTIMVRLYPPDVRAAGRVALHPPRRAGRGDAGRPAHPDGGRGVHHPPGRGRCRAVHRRTDPGWTPRRLPQRRSARRSPSAPSAIHGGPGRYVDDRSQDPYLTVGRTRPGARATVTCTREAISPETLLDVAEAVRFRDTRVPLPFTLRAVPEGYRIYSIDSDSRCRRRESHPATRRPGVDPVRRGALRQRRGRVPLPRRGRSGLPVDPLVGRRRPGSQGIVRRSLDRVGARIVLAPEPADRSTWFDAIDLPS